MKKLIIWAIALIILAQPIIALGMMPAYKTLFFDPNAQSSQTFTIINNEQKKLGVELYVEGDIKRYISLHETSTAIEGNLKTIPYTVNMPDYLKPGVHTGYIVAEEFEPEAAKGQTQIATKLKLRHRLQILSPYPRKYLEAQIETREFAEYVDIIIKLFNLGNSSINTIYAETSIFEGEKKLQTLTSSKGNLAQRAKDEILTRLSRNSIKNGVYHILADINYDGNEVSLESPLKVGEPHIKILSFTKSFKLDEINKFEVVLENEWNEEITDSHIDFYIFKDGKELDKITSPSFNLKGYEVKAVSVYWKAETLELGSYDAILILNYNSKSEETTFTIELAEAEISKVLVLILTSIIVLAGGIIIYQLYKPQPEGLHHVKELATLIRRELMKGKTFNQITSELLQSGWSKRHVKQAKKLLKKRKTK